MTHVLITRPREASLQLAGQLGGLGLDSIIMPLYSFFARAPGIDLQSIFDESDSRKLAVFTSTRAVRFGLEHIPADRSDKLEFAAVGDATRDKLKAAGLQVQLRAGSGYTSEDLLALPELAIDPGSAILFCAPGGRETLAQGLAALGWGVSIAHVYDRQTLQPTQKQLDEIVSAERLISVWTSVAALKMAQTHLPAIAWTKILTSPALVISTRIKHHLLQQGATAIELSDGPGNDSLLRSIRRIAQ